MEEFIPCDGCTCQGHKRNPRPLRTALLITGATILLLTALSFIPFRSEAQADPNAERLFTAQELAAFDGQEGRPGYFAYEGKVYNATASPLFGDGKHFGHLLGTDLTGKIEGTAGGRAAPHGEEALAKTPVVGRFGDAAIPADTAPSARDPKAVFPILIFGRTLSTWFAYLLGIFFILNFTTCFVMPWHLKKMPWTGTRPGHDKLDQRGMLFLSYHHRTFAWLTVIFGILHGIPALLRSLLGIAL